MIKKIVHLGDLHFRPYHRHGEYKEQCLKLIDDLTDLREEYGYEEVRIVIAGDIVHQKTNVSNELFLILLWFLGKLDDIFPVILLPGNHDFLENNKERVDSITPIVEALSSDNIVYLKKSKCYVDENIVWCPYSLFDDNDRPDIDDFKETHGDKVFIGIFHGAIMDSVTDVGYRIEHGVDMQIFDGLDICICADIHRRQKLMYGNTQIVYCGSMIQQNYGESIRDHGYLIWDVESLTYDAINLESDYGLYSFKISSLDDVENGKEILTNG